MRGLLGGRVPDESPGRFRSRARNLGPAFWLVSRDVAARPGRIALTAGVVAAGVALVVATELLSSGREEALAAEVDQMAPQIQIIPLGVSATALARNDLGGRRLPPGTGEQARVILGGELRELDEVLVPDESRDRRQTGEGTVNLVRVYLRAGASPRDAEDRLRAALPGTNVLRVLRSDVADGELQDSLVRHRSLLYAITATAVAICLLLAAHQEANERRLELATLIAVGGSRALLLGVLTIRGALVGATGAAAGSLAGAATALAMADGGRVATASSAWLLGAALTGSTILGAISALPTAIRSARRNPVAELQEGAT